MSNNYTSLSSSLDEEMGLKAGHEIDLERSPPSEHNSEEKSTLPSNSDILTSADPVSQASETPDHSIESNTGSTQSPTSHSLPLKFSFCIVYYSCFAIVVLGCVLPFEHTHTFLIAFLVIFGIISVILFGGSIYYYETWTKTVKHFLKKAISPFKKEYIVCAFLKTFVFYGVLKTIEHFLVLLSGDKWGWKCSTLSSILTPVSCISFCLNESVQLGSCSTLLFINTVAWIKSLGGGKNAFENNYNQLNETSPEDLV
uniref:Wtf15 n=1 Tax=Schizosaccharomyces pombe TaxID=4896 RepID=A0A482ARN1_SCHPM|nr:Wtf15 [Schizosaccharomyces pombe]QBL54344.1 Wtf15 [Schizosaccharomyces pombe]QBL54372.1 Wtf15 [Schizosaccharomyces pombe]QBL54484.1 Wtf15 [Schizosaccharomyces pombe]QBL54488.1 Wtf15 [Schizosaccharomyces pombe]